MHYDGDAERQAIRSDGAGRDRRRLEGCRGRGACRMQVLFRAQSAESSAELCARQTVVVVS